MRYFILLPIFVLSVFLFLSCGTESTPTYTLSTSVVGEGTITPSSGTYEEGEVVTITSTPSEHWVFDSWSGDGSGSSSTLTITMDRDKNVVGNFSERLYPLNITYVGEGTVTEEVIQSKSEHSFGTVVQLTPIPSDGWRFVEWSDDLSGDEDPITITITEEKNVTVTFEPIVYLGENGITIMCPDGKVGDIGIVNGVEYEVVDRDLLLQRIEEGKGTLNRRVCVSLITDMSFMFLISSFNQPIGDWDVSNVTDMNGMFTHSPFNQPIGDWDVSSVTNMSSMFSDTPFNQPIGDWDVSNVTTMRHIFQWAQFNQPIGDWDVSSVTDMNGMFFSATFNQPIGDWDVSNVTDMSSMFFISSFNQSIGDWDVSNVRDINSMFDGSSFNQPIGNWDVSNVTKMSFMFRDTPFNQPIGDWDVSSVTVMNGMFRNSSFNQPLNDWDVSNVTNMNFMFNNSQFNQKISEWCVINIIEEPREFSTGSPLTEENKPKWGTCPD